MAFGYSFAPTTDNADMGKRGGQPALRNQDPIRTLNFQLPQVSGSGISPLAGQTRAGSSIGQAVLQSVLKTVLGADAASAFLSGSPAAAQQQPPRMTMPGAPVGGERVTGGVTGGMTPVQRDPGIPEFGSGQRPPATPNPSVSFDNPEAPTWTKLPEPRASEPTGGAPDFGRGPGTFSGGMDSEGRMNNRSPLYFDKFGG